jgi:hypothetical protein
MTTCLPPRERVPTVAQRRLSLRKAPGTLKKPQFPRPIRERQAQPFHFRVPGPQQSFDFRNLPAAALGSLLPPSDSHLLERAPVAFQSGILAGVLLPSPHDYIGVARV